MNKKLCVAVLLSAGLVPAANAASPLFESAPAAAYIARPVAEDCSLVTIMSDDTVQVDRACIEVYAKKHGQYSLDGDVTSEFAFVLKVILAGKATILDGAAK